MRRVLVATAILVVSCGTAKQQELNSPELQGKPPTPEDDPFFYVARPPPEAEASTKGTIGDDEPDEPPPPPAESLEGEELRAELERARAEAVELRAKNRELRERLEDADERPSASTEESDAAECHSCVKLCPLEGRCADDAELICGWGRGKRKKDAMLRATAECDGALESVRKNGPWSRIEGKCPVASCN